MITRGGNKPDATTTPEKIFFDLPHLRGSSNEFTRAIIHHSGRSKHAHKKRASSSICLDERLPPPPYPGVFVPKRVSIFTSAGGALAQEYSRPFG